MLKDKYYDLKMQLFSIKTLFNDECNHEWGEIEYSKHHEPIYYTEVKNGEEITSIVGSRVIPVYNRTCIKCGKVIEVKQSNKEKIIKYPSNK